MARFRPRIGSLRDRVSIERRSESKDDYGQPVEEWVEWAAEVPAEVQEGRGTEGRFDEDQIEATGPRRIRIRYIPGVEAKMRVIHRGRPLEIVSADDQLGTRRWLVLWCSEVR